MHSLELYVDVANYTSPPDPDHAYRIHFQTKMSYGVSITLVESFRIHPYHEAKVSHIQLTQRMNQKFAII
jgi:hypothetical protein